MTSKHMPKFLIVDDDPNILALVRRILTRAFPGCAVVAADNGRKGLDAARQELPDVAILDVNLPVMDGFELCTAIKSDPATATIPVLLVTGERADTTNRLKGLNLGADGYLYKPYMPDEFAAQVQVMLRIKTAEDQLRRQKAELEEAFRLQTLELEQNREALRQKVAVLEKTVEQQTQELIRADRLASVGILSAGIAHEVNNPNTFIVSNLQTFKLFWRDLDAMLSTMPCPSPEQARRLEFIRAEVPGIMRGMEEGSRRIDAIVKGMKVYASGDSLDHRIVDLAEIVDSALRLVNNHIKHDIEVRKAMPPDLPKVYGSEQLLCQVFVNLFLNAAHAMKEHRGEGVLTIQGGLADGHYVVISVKDTGHGIRPEDMKNLFNPFFTTRRDKGGTGLGLFVSHGIVKGHNGLIEVESEPGAGTTFRIKIPMIDKNQSVEVQVEEESTARTTGSRSNA